MLVGRLAEREVEARVACERFWRLRRKEQGCGVGGSGGLGIGVVALRMAAKRVVRGQQVSRAKVDLALKLRREMTPQEALLWQRLRAGRLEELHFRRQQVIDGFVVDFYCHRAGMVVEVDGPVHADQPDYDAQRDEILTARNLKIMRLTNTEIEQHLGAVLKRIAAAANERRTTLRRSEAES